MGKGLPPKRRQMPVCLQLGRQETPAGLSLKKFCEALSMAVGLVGYCYFTRLFHGPLDKAVHFFTEIGKAEKERKMKQ